MNLGAPLPATAAKHFLVELVWKSLWGDLLSLPLPQPVKPFRVLRALANADTVRNALPGFHHPV